MNGPVNTKLFEIASTLFLGIGITAVLADLLPANVEASRRGRARFGSLDVAVSALMFVLIAAGEFMCIRVLAAGHTKSALAHDASPWVIALLVITGGYVVLQYVGSQALAHSWRRTAAGQPAVTAYDELFKLIGAAAMGFGIGGLVLSRLAKSDPDFFLISPDSLSAVWGVGLLLIIAGALMRWPLSRSFSRHALQSGRGPVPGIGEQWTPR